MAMKDIPLLKQEDEVEADHGAATTTTTGSASVANITTTSISCDEQQRQQEQHERNVKDFITQLLRSKSGGSCATNGGAPAPINASKTTNAGGASASYQWKSRDACSLLNSNGSNNAGGVGGAPAGVSDFLKSVDAFIDRHVFSTDGGENGHNTDVNIDDLVGKFQSDTSFNNEATKSFLDRFKSSDWRLEYGPPDVDFVDPKVVFDSTDDCTSSSNKNNVRPAAVASAVAAKGKTATTASSTCFADKFKSTDWKQQYESSHVDVDPGTVFSLSSSEGQQQGQHQQAPATAAAVVVPALSGGGNAKAPPSSSGVANSGSGGGTDWNAMFMSGLPSASATKAQLPDSQSQQPRSIMGRPTDASSAAAAASAMTLLQQQQITSTDSSMLPSMPPLKDATALPAPTSLLKGPPPPPSKPKASSPPRKSRSKNGNKQQSSSATKRKKPASGAAGNRKSKKDPDVKVYYEPKDEDVLLGRGGRTNHHIGNKRYLQEKLKIQPRYMAATKEEKTGISQELVDRIRNNGGRFLELDSSCNKWFEVTAIKARKKASQTLRELNTPEERAAKRARYNR